MVDNKVPPHMTILSMEAPSEEALLQDFDRAMAELERGDIIIPSIGQLLPYVLFASPVMNDYLLDMQAQLIKTYSKVEGVSFSKYYCKNSWQPHITLGKTLDTEQMEKAFKYMQRHFSPLEGSIVRIGLARTNPHRDLIIKEL